MPSVRAQIVTRRSYNRPLDEEGKVFETWDQTIDRVLDHQKWLWERAKGRSLNKSQLDELEEVGRLMRERKVFPSGRTLWLGGTEIARRREASMFNCAFTKVETVHDVVDVLWLLLQGCGVGFRPIVGNLNGFARRIPRIEVIRSKRTIEQWKAGERGRETNLETWDRETKTWTISIGDSAEAWAKSAGKLVAGKYPAETLVLDFSEIRAAGIRLKGYGWISSGDQAISTAYLAIAKILNRRAGNLLTRMDILDIINWLGTILSSRRSSEICLFEYGEPEWDTFAAAKKEFWLHGNEHRQQSNNTLLFNAKPSRAELEDIFRRITDAGGSEPGIANAKAALRRAPWFVGFNPCAEILLGSKCFCNLVEIDVSKFRDDPAGLHRAVTLTARMNYRQTLVNLDDGILQRAWHENNEFLRLCGVGLTGIVKRPDLSEYDYRTLRNLAIAGAYAMADELGTQRPKNVTTIKPSGTLSKAADTTEGLHKPLGRYIFNNIKFSAHDPLVTLLRSRGYEVFDSPNPTDVDTVIAKIPVEFDGIEFDVVDGKEVNLESAVDQLNRYKMLMRNYVDHNASITVSYDLSEVPAIIDWLLENWDEYVGVSFLYRNDPTKTAADLGYPYLPQEVVTEEVFREYVSRLQPIDLEAEQANSLDELEIDDCATGACPIR